LETISSQLSFLRTSSQSLAILAALPEKILQKGGTIVLQNAGGDFTAVIQTGHLQQVHHASGSAGSQIRASKN
jgi:hypothetical protein